MKLVVGLGNIGRKYEGTRHNVGFATVAELARRDGSGSARGQFNGEVVEADLDGVRTLLLSPHTLMNRSGSSVVQAKEFFKLGLDDLLVVCDDFNLSLARLRIRGQGTAGGQKGLEDIIRCLGGNEFARLRIGIGPVPDRWEAADFVLGKFKKEEQAEIDFAIPRAADAAVVWAKQGVAACMNRFNASPDGERGWRHKASGGVRPLIRLSEITISGRRVLSVNTYEGMFILDSNRYSRDPSAAPQQISSLLEKFGGEVLASRLWDDGRKLAYPIGNHKKGTYWLAYFNLDSGRLVALNRECRINEAMLRHLFIKLDPRVAPTLVSVARGEAQPRPARESPAPPGQGAPGQGQGPPGPEQTNGQASEVPDKDAE